MNENNILKVKKIFILLLFILFFLLVLIISLIYTIKGDRKVNFLDYKVNELALRGNIYSYDNFKISSSIKLYKATIDTRYLDTNKTELFIRLFSIYSNLDEEKIRDKVYESLKDPASLILSYNIDSRTAKNLKELSMTLRKLDVFEFKNFNGQKNLVGLDITESGEKRLYSYNDTLTPVIGYIRKKENELGKTRVEGIKGIEKYFNEQLNNMTNGILEGKRDVLSYVVLDKNSKLEKRIDGEDIKLNIPLKLQKNIEKIIDSYKSKLNADEIIVSVMESKTGNIITLASSNRFNPENILQEQIPYLDVKAIEYPFEPGSIIKPISIALAMDKNKIKPNELFNAYNNGNPNSKGEYPKGKYKLDRYYIHDDHRFKKHYLTLEDIVINSSNIGTLIIAQRLSGEELLKGMKSFGFLNKTGVELPYEKIGIFPSLNQLSAFESQGKDNVFKSTVSYGQGMTATFIQLLKAYSVFNNDGKIVTPRITNYNEPTSDKIIQKSTSDKIKQLLIKTVEEGTGSNTLIEGLEIGGKTGTAQIAQNGYYQKKYISSFFGFANDKDKSYTIGVTVFNPNSKGEKYYQYYASQSAVPVFKEVINILVKLNYLNKSI